MTSWVSKLLVSSSVDRSSVTSAYTIQSGGGTPDRPNQDAVLSLHPAHLLCHRYSVLEFGLAFRAPTVLVLRLSGRVQMRISDTTL